MTTIYSTLKRAESKKVGESPKLHVITDYRNIDKNKWDGFVSSHPNGNFFQTQAFCAFISRIKEYEAIAVTVTDDNGNVLGIITGMIQKEKGKLKSLLTTRLIVLGGPLVQDPGTEITHLLLTTLIQEHSSRCIYFEFRNLFAMQQQSEVFRRNGFTYADHLNFRVPITSRDQTTKQISSTRNRYIRKSIKNNAKILSDVSTEQVRKFYQILKNLYASKVGKPLPPWEFFEEFMKTPALGKYFLIEYNNEIVGGIMCPIFENKCIYEWYVAGEDGMHEGIYPSTIATWAPIDYALQNGIAWFDFMGAGKPDEDYGVRDFKGTFGGELVQYGRFTRVNNKLLYQIGKLGIRVLKMIR